MMNLTKQEMQIYLGTLGSIIKMIDGDSKMNINQLKRKLKSEVQSIVDELKGVSDGRQD